MTPKEEAIERAISLLRIQHCTGRMLIDNDTRKVLTELLQSHTVERDEVIEECAKIAEHEGRQLHSRLKAVSELCEEMLKEVIDPGICPGLQYSTCEAKYTSWQQRLKQAKGGKC